MLNMILVPGFMKLQFFGLMSNISGGVMSFFSSPLFSNKMGIVAAETIETMTMAMRI